jgi:hypothetical protein
VAGFLLRRKPYRRIWQPARPQKYDLRDISSSWRAQSRKSKYAGIDDPTRIGDQAAIVFVELRAVFLTIAAFIAIGT